MLNYPPIVLRLDGELPIPQDMQQFLQFLKKKFPRLLSKTKIFRWRLQATLVIRRFFIRGFAYSQSKKIYQNSVFAVFPSLICGFLKEFSSKVCESAYLIAYSAPSLFAGSVFAVLGWNASTANYEGNLYIQNMYKLKYKLKSLLDCGLR